MNKASVTVLQLSCFRDSGYLLAAGRACFANPAALQFTDGILA